MLLHGADRRAEVGHEGGAHGDGNTRDGGKAAADLVGTGGEAGAVAVHVQGRVGLEHPLPLELLHVADSELKDIGLFQLGDGLPLRLKSIDHEILELIQALVDPGPPLPLQERLHHLPVLVRPRHGGLRGGGGRGGGGDCHEVVAVDRSHFWLSVGGGVGGGVG